MKLTTAAKRHELLGRCACWFAAGVAGLLVMSPVARAADASAAKPVAAEKPADKPAGGKPAAAAAGSPAARAIAAKGSDFDRLPVVLGLEGESLEKYKKSLAERDAAYKKWAESEKGKAYAAAQKELAAADGTAAPGAGRAGGPNAGGARRPGRRPNQGGPQAAPQAAPQTAPAVPKEGAAPDAASKDAANPKLVEAKKKYEPLRAEQETLRKELRAEMNKQFSAAQLRVWAGHMLYDRAIDRFAQSKLSDDQKQQAQVVCWILTADLDESAAQKDPYLMPDAKLLEKAVADIRMYVLRTEQMDSVRSATVKTAAR